MKRSKSTQSCGCCEGVESVMPLPVANRPGLAALVYRAGTHATFLESMLARLSTLTLEADVEAGRPESLRPLDQLTTRAENDPAMALLDAWAIVADVLTFYQERIANEGYLLTATERRSILELARLVGHKLRPGVAASVYLAFTLEQNQQVTVPAGTPAQNLPGPGGLQLSGSPEQKQEIVIPVGTRAQSVPGPGELPQSFETSDPLPARAEWNALKPRLERPPYITLGNAQSIDTLYVDGLNNNLKPNDPLLLVFGQDANQQVLRWIDSVELQATALRTQITLQGVTKEAMLGDFAVALAQVLAQYIGAAPTGTTAQDAVQKLAELQAELKQDPGKAAVLLGTDTLPALQKMYQGLPASFTTLKPWAGGLVADLGKIAHHPAVKAAIAGASSGSMDASGSKPPATALAVKGQTDGAPVSKLFGLLDQLAKPPSLQPANALKLKRSAQEVFTARTDFAPGLLTTVVPKLTENLYAAWANIAVTPDPDLQKLLVLRVKASFFGHNLPGLPIFERDDTTGLVKITRYSSVSLHDAWPDLLVESKPQTTIALDAEYDQIKPNSWVAIDRPNLDAKGQVIGRILSYHQVKSVQVATMSALGLAAKVTQLALDPPWLDGMSPDQIGIQLRFPALLRSTIVYTQSEKLTPVDEPITTPICGQEIELGVLADGLKAGRWLIISGERDIPGTEGVKASELVMLSGVTQDVYHVDLGNNEEVDLPGDTTHTFLQLADALAYCYKRDTVTLYGNVVKATHGETRKEVLGSGDGRKAWQRFTLKQFPLTYVSAPTAAGAASTLEVRVNEVRWHETDSLVLLQPDERAYIVETGDDDKTAVIFGDGEHGARLPTGPENIQATYRSGIGKPGNVAAEKISTLATRPLGVKGVVNPLRASGGADRESRDQARRNTPLAVMALDRLVSVQDYADFARTFAGIGKASAVRLAGSHRSLVHLTIAGADDIPIDKNSDLYRNLRLALRQNGDPHQPFRVDVRELMLLVISANIRLLPDYAWESVAPQVRSALLDSFSFERRDLGQGVWLSEVVSVIQGVPGVEYVDVDLLDSISETEATDATLLAEKLKELAGSGGSPTGAPRKSGKEERPKQHIPVELAHLGTDGTLYPAQLAFLSPDLPDTLILTELS
jgi:hypothetical protein